jgi:hypothetical protein
LILVQGILNHTQPCSHQSPNYMHLRPFSMSPLRILEERFTRNSFRQIFWILNTKETNQSQRGDRRHPIRAKQAMGLELDSSYSLFIILLDYNIPIVIISTCIMICAQL